MNRRPMLAATIGLTTVLSSFGATASAATPYAQSFNGWPAVGALFSNPYGSGTHGCSASVIHSSTHDLIMTAAHCVSGTGRGMSFVPDYRYGAKPFGTWQVTQAYATSAWRYSVSPSHDYVILRVAKKYINGRWKGVEDLTHGYTVATEPAYGSWAWVAGYDAGSYDRPINCVNRVTYTAGYPTFNCGGYLGGTSGSPFIKPGAVNTIRGVIGGLHQGGCVDYISYSSPFTSETIALLSRAEAGGAGDTLPSAGSDGC